MSVLKFMFFVIIKCMSIVFQKIFFLYASFLSSFSYYFEHVNTLTWIRATPFFGYDSSTIAVLYVITLINT